MWELDCEESSVLKNWCFRTVVLEKTLESPLDCKEIQPVHPKGDQSWVFIGWTDVEAETPILWSPDAESWLIEKTLMLGKIEGRRRRGQQRMRWLHGITDSRTWISANSGRWWRKGKAGVLQSMGSQTVWHDLATEQQQIIKKIKNNFKTVHQFSSVTQPCLTLCHPMNHSTQGLTVHHQLHEFTQTHVHWVNDVIQPSHPLLSPSPAPNPSQH